MTKKRATIYLASDHAGFALKQKIGDFLRQNGWPVTDCGAFDDAPSDYPDFILRAALLVAKSRGQARGLVFGGSGIGECVAANKVRGIRAALVYDAYTARKSREHNDANVLCLGGRTVTRNAALAKRLVRLWLATPFSRAPRHVRRLKKISDFEKRC